MKRKKAIVLLSGGLDSSTALYVARSKGYAAACLIFDYGQRHRRELESARKIVRLARAPFYVLKIAFPWRASSLLDTSMAVPVRRRIPKDEIPSTYVPARNTVFLSFALSFAEAAGARDIFIGANALDYSGYPDCRPAYFRAFGRLAALATACGVYGRNIRIQVPLIRLKKSEIITLGVELGVPYEATWSCYRGGKRPCGACDSCVLRAKGFREAGIEDPLLRCSSSYNNADRKNF